VAIHSILFISFQLPPALAGGLIIILSRL